MAEDAVQHELFSGHNFPASSEKYREFLPMAGRPHQISADKLVFPCKKTVDEVRWNRCRTGKKQGKKFPAWEFRRMLLTDYTAGFARRAVFQRMSSNRFYSCGLGFFLKRRREIPIPTSYLRRRILVGELQHATLGDKPELKIPSVLYVPLSIFDLTFNRS